MHYAYIDEVWSQDPISKAVGPSPYPSPPPPPKKSPPMEVVRQQRPAETMSIFSVFMFALIAFVLYDVLKSSI